MRLVNLAYGSPDFTPRMKPVEILWFNYIPFVWQGPLWSWQPPKASGLYCILAPDRGWTPYALRPIYFGETANFANRGVTDGSHDSTDRWQAEARWQDLCVAVHYTADAPEQHRFGLESRLINSYRPACNLTVKRGISDMELLRILLRK